MKESEYYDGWLYFCLFFVVVGWVVPPIDPNVYIAASFVILSSKNKTT